MNWPKDELESLRQQHLLRELRWAERAAPRTFLNRQPILLLCSNNYLGLADHPTLIAAANRATEQYGCSASASRLISGSLELHRQLEERVATFMSSEAALVFNSGYQANVGLIPALAGETDLIFSDELNHASLIDGCRLARGETQVFRHTDAEHLETLLEQSQNRNGKRIILTESIFSVDGNSAPLAEIVQLARRFDALIVVDEAHAVGVLGPDGTGLVGELHLEDQVDLRMGTFSKALGSFGAFVAGREQVIQYLINRTRSLIYSTALPPATVAASLAALDVVGREPERRRALWENVKLIREGLKAQGWTLLSEAGHIVPILVGEAGETMEITRELLAQGVFVQGLRPPTVPPGTCCLRVTPMATHSREDLAEALKAFEKIRTPRNKQKCMTVSATTS